jgi:hypothetical protein
METHTAPAWLIARIGRMVALEGDGSLVSAEYVVTTWSSAVKDAYGSDQGRRECYRVVLRGHFVHWKFHGPAGASPPRGTVIVLSIDATSCMVVSYSIGRSCSRSLCVRASKATPCI